MKLLINTDGGARGNPGPAAFGVVIKNQKGELLYRGGEYMGKATNNQAEYTAVLFALLEATKLGGTDLSFNLDSELVVKQLNGEYKVRNKQLADIYLQIHNKKTSFAAVSFHHVYREKNKEADKIVNEILDSRAEL